LQEITSGPWWFRHEEDYSKNSKSEDYYSLQLINTEERREIARDPYYEMSRQFLWEPTPKSYFLVEISDDLEMQMEDSPVAAAFGSFLSSAAFVIVEKLTSKKFRFLKSILSVFGSASASNEIARDHNHGYQFREFVPGYHQNF